MTTRGRQRATPLVLAALAFALALLQRPGWSSSDTKIDLHTDPLRFLGEAASLWTPSSGLGGVESAQYSGYLFPMGPFFALGHALGVSDWVVDRLWLGLLLAVGCWGIVRLVRALGAAGSPVGELTAGLVYLLNPYVVVFANRTSGFLLAYVLLPWMVLATWRGLRDPGRWRHPAIFALLVTSSLGGVNAAVIGLALLAPLALVLYEPLTRAVSWRDSGSFGWRALVATTAASLWWMAPAAAQSVYGNDFLRFTEPAGAIWATTSLSESFRAMGYWISYIGVGYNGVVRPYFSDSGVLLFHDAIVWATFLVPGLALLGFAWTRTRRYAPYFLLLVLLGTLVMTVGFPEGTPLRRGATFAYNHFAGTRFLRTTYKAGPLVVLGVAALAAMLAELVAQRRGRRGVAALLAVAALAVIALSAWPLVRGDAVDRQVSWKRIPAAWRDTAHELDRSLGDDRRAVVLPGQLYAFYRWGGTVDPILPALTKKPVAVRVNAPYEDLRGADLLWTTDALVQQDRVLPGQLLPLLRLMGAGRVVTATDDDVFRSGSARPADAAAALAGQGLGRPVAYGPRRRFAQAPDAVGPPVVLPEVRTYAVAGARPLVRVEPRGTLGVVDGSAEGLAGLAGFGALPARAPFAYAADLSPAAIAAAARQGGTVAITDSNRRRIQVVSRMSQNTGATLGAGDPISQDAATLNPFASRGSAGQTVAVLHGARWIRAPFSPGYPQFPEHRPFAAFDGDPQTAWLADRALQGPRHWVEVGFNHPRDVPYVDVLPRAEAGAIATAVAIGGHRYPLRRGWTRLRLGLKHVPSLRIRVITGGGGSAAAAGLAEVRVPGLHVSESLRPPLLAEQALRGTDVSHATLTYAFSRATGDAPWRRTRSAGLPVAQRVTDANRLEQLHVESPGDEETTIDRVIAPPAARAWTAQAWISALPEARDSALDRLAGYRGPVVADSSARFDGLPGYRASSAVDGDPTTAWAAPWRAGLHPWLRLTAARPFALGRLGLVPPTQGIAAPAAVTVAWDGGHTGALPVVAGRVVLPAPVRTRTLKLTVVRSRSPRAAAVGIAELRVPGLVPMRIPRTGALAAGCGAVTVATAGGPLRLRPTADVKTLDSGAPMRATGCGPPLRLPAGSQRLRAPAGPLRLDRLLLTSPAPHPVARSAVAAGTVTDPGSPGNGSREGVKLSVRAPAWLVLGESYDRGWHATCNGRSLGTPVPLDGYANAWRVGPGCHTAGFEFAPQKPVRIVQILSALACLLLLLVALRGRGRAREPEPAATAALPDRPPGPVRAGRAVLAGLIAGGALAFCFSLRSGLVIAPAIAVVLWLGIAAEPLALAGGLLLAVVVPLVYIAFPVSDQGGFNPSYPLHHIGAHWVAVAAWVLLALALWRALSTARAGARRAP